MTQQQTPSSAFEAALDQLTRCYNSKTFDSCAQRYLHAMTAKGDLKREIRKRGSPQSDIWQLIRGESPLYEDVWISSPNGAVSIAAEIVNRGLVGGIAREMNMVVSN